MDEIANPHRPLWRGFGIGSVVFVVFIVGMTLFQFFLQFALAPEYSNTSEFWIQGVLSGLSWGAALGIVPAAAIGFLTWSKAAPIKIIEQNNDLITEKKQIAEGATTESARHKRNIMGFALILFVPTILCIVFMFVGVWLMQ